MAIVVDTSILFSFFKETVTRRIILALKGRLIAPSYARDELKRYAPLICTKAKITAADFMKRLDELETIVTFVPAKEYAPALAKARIVSPDPDDVDFFALALYRISPLWSHDAAWREQEKVQVFTTADLLSVLD